jgi:transposase InsO family protein
MRRKAHLRSAAGRIRTGVERVRERKAVGPTRILAARLLRRRGVAGLHHSDRRSQYASGDDRRALAAQGMVCSMSRRGNCWDNAVAESFFATLKVELVRDAAWATRATARAELIEYLEVLSRYAGDLPLL